MRRVSFNGRAAIPIMKMDENFKDSFERATAFQNLWVDSMTGLAQAWTNYSPSDSPPEDLKKVRQRMLGAMSKSWEDFMRTPQFMEMMRESLNNAVAWGANAKEGANRVHETMGTAAKQDIDGVLLAIRHVEKRILDRLETLQENIEGLQSDLSTLGGEHADEINDAFQKEIIRRLSLIEENLMKKPAPAKAPQKKAAPRATKAVRKTKATKTAKRK